MENYTKIGIVVGGGTGVELSNIFEKYLRKIAEKHQKKVVFERTDEMGYTPFGSYVDIKKQKNPQEYSDKEAADLVNIYEKWKGEGVPAVFRTSVNAEALYTFRRQVKGLKEFKVDTDNGSHILAIRDLQDGFYANTSYQLNKKRDKLVFTGEYTKKRFQDLLDYALSNRKDEDAIIWLVYKLHLFSGIFEEWLADYLEKNPAISVNNIHLYQPDTALSNLFDFIRHQKNKELILVCSNEIGDLLYEPILESVQNVSEKVSLYAISKFFLSNNDFLEYQTIHGSADDKKDTNRVLPYATFRIISAIAETIFGISNCRAIMDDIMAEVKIDLYNNIAPPTTTIITKKFEEKMIACHLINSKKNEYSFF